MARKVFLVRWNEPSKYLKGETILKWETFGTKEEAQKRFDEAKQIESATNLELQETEITSM